MPAWPVRVDGKPPRVASSPVPGEHTADMLACWLEMRAADVKGLRAKSVLQRRAVGRRRADRTPRRPL